MRRCITSGNLQRAVFRPSVHLLSSLPLHPFYISAGLAGGGVVRPLRFLRQTPAEGIDGCPVHAAHGGGGGRLQCAAGTARLAVVHAARFILPGHRHAGGNPAGARLLQHDHRHPHGQQRAGAPGPAAGAGGAGAGRGQPQGLAGCDPAAAARAPDGGGTAGLPVRLHQFRRHPAAGGTAILHAGSGDLRAVHAVPEPADGGAALADPTALHAGLFHAVQPRGEEFACREHAEAGDSPPAKIAAGGNLHRPAWRCSWRRSSCCR